MVGMDLSVLRPIFAAADIVPRHDREHFHSAQRTVPFPTPRILLSA